MTDTAARFDVRLAGSEAEILECLKLRYRVFAGELGAAIDGGELGIDRDRFDAHCRHLLVRDLHSGDVVASTRLLCGDGARAAGDFYSAGEFDLGMIDSLPGRVLEVGRTCVDADYRNGAVIAALWQGLAGVIIDEGFDYLFGCASIGLEDGGASAHAIIQRLHSDHLSPPWQRVRPRSPLPADDGGAVADARPRLPPLLKAYLSLGARACGEAYWDRDFNCADVFMLLNVSEMNPRYARHFLHGGTRPGGRRLAA